MERNKRNRWVEEWRGEGRRKEQSQGRKGHQERCQTQVWISVLRFFAMREETRGGGEALLWTSGPTVDSGLVVNFQLCMLTALL